MAKWASTPKSDDDIQDLINRVEGDLSGAEFFKYQDGENEVRLLPGTDEEPLPFAKRQQHWRVGPQEKTFNCPKAIDETASCFVCDKREALKKSDDPADQEKAEDLYAKRQYLYRIIDMERQKKGVQIMNAGIKLHKQIAKLLASKHYGYAALFDPIEGLPVIITKSGSGQFGTEYHASPLRNSDDISALIADVEPPDIFALCEPATNAVMKAAWEGAGDGKDKPAAEPSRRREESVDEEPVRRANREPAEEPRASRRREEPEPEAPRRSREPAEEPRARVVDDAEPEPRGRRLATGRSRDED